MKNTRKQNRNLTQKPLFKFNSQNIKETILSPSNRNSKNLLITSPLKKQSEIIKQSPNLKLEKSSSTNITQVENPSNQNQKIDNKQHNKNIKVYIRFRPFNIIEKDFLSKNIGWETPEYENNEIIKINTQKPNENNNNNNNSPQFKFDKVFKSETEQIEIYNLIGNDIVKDVMEGYNGTIFAYGQSGSGKTYTMYGSDIDDEDKKGLIPRIVNNIFDYVENSNENIIFQFKLSVIQIYKEIIYDLLTGEKNLKLKENPTKGIYVENLSEVYLSSVDDFLNYAELAEKNRKVGETKLNQQSSRSHSIMILEILQQFKNENLIKKGILNLVDLAGSEKVSKTGAIGETLEEAKKINLSLSALGNVIHSLTSNSEHIPYRDSKLTRILQESLGGNYKTSLIVNCSPHSYNLEETISSLQFAQRVKTIKNKVKVNIKYSYEELQQMVEKLTKKLENANLKIFKLKNGEKCDLDEFDNCTKCDILKEDKKNLEEKIEELMNEIKEKNDRIRELENSDCKNNQSLNESFTKDKINKLYKEIKNMLDDIKDNYLKFENDNIKEFVFYNNDTFISIFDKFIKENNFDKNLLFDDINSLMKKSYDIKNNEKYESIYNEYIKNLKEIFENKIKENNNISDKEKLNLFSIGYFYDYLKYYFSYQLLNDGYEKIKIDNNLLLNMTKSLLSLVDNILSSNYEMASDTTINTNALNFLTSTILENNNNNNGNNQNQVNNNINNQLNIQKFPKRMSVTFGNELQKNLVKIVTKQNMNIKKHVVNKRCSMILTPIDQIGNSNIIPRFKRGSVTIPIMIPSCFNNNNINNNNNYNDIKTENNINNNNNDIKTENNNNNNINNEIKKDDIENENKQVESNVILENSISEASDNSPIDKMQKVFNKTEKKQSKLNMIKDLIVANVTKTEELINNFEKQKNDFEKIINFNKEYFTNLILKKENISSTINDTIVEMKNNNKKKTNLENQNENNTYNNIVDISKKNNNNLKSHKNTFLKSSSLKSNNDSFIKKEKNEKIKLKNNNKNLNNINTSDYHFENNPSHISNYSRNNSNFNTNKIGQSERNSIKKNLKLHENSLKINLTKKPNYHNKSNSEYSFNKNMSSINNNLKERKVFSLEKYIQKYLETGTVTRRFDGIKVNYEKGKVKLEYEVGLSANHQITGSPLLNQRLTESKGDEDSVQSNLVLE